jgi:hypothetical protein
VPNVFMSDEEYRSVQSSPRPADGSTTGKPVSVATGTLLTA